MSASIEKAIILLTIAVLSATCIYSVRVLEGRITEEEAIEISKSSEVVKEGMASHGYFSFEATYYNLSWVEKMKKGHNRNFCEKVPEGHGIWEVDWTFTVSKECFIGYITIIIVDAEWGIILHETKGVSFG
jgi:hypothetical protein